MYVDSKGLAILFIDTMTSQPEEIQTTEMEITTENQTRKFSQALPLLIHFYISTHGLLKIY